MQIVYNNHFTKVSRHHQQQLKSYIEKGIEETCIPCLFTCQLLKNLIFLLLLLYLQCDAPIQNLVLQVTHSTKSMEWNFPPKLFLQITLNPCWMLIYLGYQKDICKLGLEPDFLWTSSTDPPVHFNHILSA